MTDRTPPEGMTVAPCPLRGTEGATLVDDTDPIVVFMCENFYAWGPEHRNAVDALEPREPEPLGTGERYEVATKRPEPREDGLRPFRGNHDRRDLHPLGAVPLSRVHAVRVQVVGMGHQTP